MSAYATPHRAGYDETAPVAELADPASEDVRADYGALKVACERVVAEVFAGRSTSIRAGLIVGPHDPTDRFTYWVTRAAAGGELLAPAPPERQVQFVDVRDLGEWIVSCCEARTAGVFNATGPLPAVTMRELVEACLDVAGADARPVWVDDDFLVERGVGPWLELPLWIPASDRDFADMQTADVSRAVGAGLRFRPVAETVRDTLAWARSHDGQGAGTAAMGGTDGVGLRPERERELLAAWRARR